MQKDRRLIGRVSTWLTWQRRWSQHNDFAYRIYISHWMCWLSSRELSSHSIRYLYIEQTELDYFMLITAHFVSVLVRFHYHWELLSTFTFDYENPCQQTLIFVVLLIFDYHRCTQIDSSICFCCSLNFSLVSKNCYCYWG